jgi:hypothetical protein
VRKASAHRPKYSCTIDLLGAMSKSVIKSIYHAQWSTMACDTRLANPGYNVAVVVSKFVSTVLFTLPLLTGRHESFAIRCPFFLYGRLLPLNWLFSVGPYLSERVGRWRFGFGFWKWWRCCSCRLRCDESVKGDDFGFE